MSEEQQEQQEQAKDENVGTSLLSALFQKAEEAEDSEPINEPEAEPEQAVAYGLSDAINQSVAPEEPEITEKQDEPKEEPELEKLDAVDKSLFEGVEISESEEVQEEVIEEKQPEPENDLNWLTDDQKKRLELVEFAESNFPEYDGVKDKHIEFFKAHRDYIDSRLQEDPSATLDGDDHDYQVFLNRRMPKFGQEDIEKVVELRTRTLAKEEAMNELKPELDALREEQRKQKIAPQVQKLKKQTLEDIKNMFPEDFRELMDTVGPEKTYEQDPIKYEIINKVVSSHQSTMFALHEITQGLTPFDPSNPSHVQVQVFIDKLEASMPEKDGKKYVSIAEYGSLKPSEKSKSYTLTHSDIVQKANESAQRFLNKEINDFEEKLRKSGYTRALQEQANEQIAPAPAPVKPLPRQGHTVQGVKQAPAKSSITSVLGL